MLRKNGYCSKFVNLFTFVFVLWALVFLSAISSPQAETDIYVLGYEFPPFVEGGDRGLTPKLIALLNGTQTEFNFSFVLTSPARRYQDLASGKGHVVFFEMPEWGWSELGSEVGVSREIMSGGEIYITAANQGRDQSFFDGIGSKSIAAFFGYHYGFANYNADQEYLTENFDIRLNHNHETNIRLVRNNRVDLAIVTESYFAKYLAEHPELNDQFLISETKDQVYSLRVITGPASPISVSQLEAMLEVLKENGLLQDLLREFGSEDQLTF